MATAIYAFGQFSDGTFASFDNANVTAETSTEILTGGTGLNQASGNSMGQQFEGKVLVAMSILVQTDDDTTGAFIYGYITAPSGQVVSIVRGGDYQGQPIRPLCQPILMQNGMKLFAAYDVKQDAVAQASLAVYCASGRSEVFTIKAVNNTKTPMVSVVSGSSIGESLAGETILKYYATYPSSKGLNDMQNGNSAFYVESADGQLKYMFPPQAGNETDGGVDLGDCLVPVTIQQNDTLSVMASIS